MNTEEIKLQITITVGQPWVENCGTSCTTGCRGFETCKVKQLIANALGGRSIMNTEETTKPHHGHKWMPCLYATYYGMLKEIAEGHGYALAIHGSFTRDMDLIAVPWIADPKPHLQMLGEFRKVIGINGNPTPYDSYEQKPNGRIAYTLQTGGGGYLDISVIVKS